MATTVKFGSFLAASDLSVSSRVVIAPKGKMDLAKLTQVKAAFASVDASVTAPLQLKEGGASTVTVWHKQGETLQQLVFTEYANELSRNTGVVRADKINEVAAAAVPATGNSQLTVVVPTAAEAFSAGLAVARNWPIYTRKTGSKAADRTVFVDIVAENGDKINFVEIQGVADAIRNAQRLVDMPCAENNTDGMVAEAKRIAELLNSLPNKQGKVDVEVIRGEELRERGFGGIYGVGKAAEFPPALVILSYTPNAGVNKTVAMVGKGIVYDCGGLSLKPTNGMCGMKVDMGGSAAVLGAFHAHVVANGGHKVKLHALLCLAENAIDAKSFKNDDVLQFYSGKTAEINNTDAEGRLVLADGVAYASKHLNPDAITVTATLTGAQLLVSGKQHAAILCNDDDIEQRLIKAGKTSGDLVYPMIYNKDLMKLFESQVADMKNSVSDRMSPGSSAAGHFVEAHLAEDYKGSFGHIDIAGPSANAKGRGTGHGAALLYTLVKNY